MTCYLKVRERGESLHSYRSAAHRQKYFVSRISFQYLNHGAGDYGHWIKVLAIKLAGRS